MIDPGRQLEPAPSNLVPDFLLVVLEVACLGKSVHALELGDAISEFHICCI